MTQPPLQAKPLCDPRCLSFKPKRRHRIEDYMAYNTPIDPKFQDQKERARGAANRLGKALWNKAVATPNPSIAIYAHYNSSEKVSQMVLKQLELLQEQGFAVYFVSMSKIDDDADRHALQERTTQAWVRRSFGRDFGAWYDVWMVQKESFLQAKEVIFLNDSVVGPIFPIEPVFEGLRRGQDGLYGLIDSPDVVPHLQTFFLYFRGEQTIETLGDFFAHLKLSFSKKAMIRRGELAISKFFKKRKIPVSALFSYSDVERAMLDDLDRLEAFLCFNRELCPEALQILQAFFKARDAKREETARALLRQLQMRVTHQLLGLGLNPTHHHWRTLVDVFKFPYIKTELLKLNPARIPDIVDWSELVPEDSPVSASMIKEHLATM